MEFIRPQRGGQFCRGKLFAHSRPPRKPLHMKSARVVTPPETTLCLSVYRAVWFICVWWRCLFVCARMTVSVRLLLDRILLTKVT